MYKRQVIARIPWGDPDRYGQTNYVETERTLGGHVRQVRTTDDFSLAATVVTELIEAYFPIGTDLSDIYAIDWDGERYEVQGNPKRPFNPRTGQYEYISVIAKVVST